jgi:hypothetical protein
MFCDTIHFYFHNSFNSLGYVMQMAYVYSEAGNEIRILFRCTNNQTFVCEVVCCCVFVHVLQ